MGVPPKWMVFSGKAFQKGMILGYHHLRKFSYKGIWDIKSMVTYYGNPMVIKSFCMVKIAMNLAVRLQFWPEITVISRNKAPLIECVLPFIIFYNQL